jgi:hypothetical protein
MAQTNLRKTFTPFALKFQNNLRLFPKTICLITGAPRSGTSALCEWLGEQPSVSAFPESRILISAHRFLEEAFRFKNLAKDEMELADLARQLVLAYYSRSRVLMNGKLVLDKEPLEPIAFPSREYGQFIHNYKTIFPKGKLLFAIRDPLATVWSMSQRVWGESLTVPNSRKFTIEEYSENWCACADLLLKLAAQENTYIVQFGNLINDSKNESKRIFDFLNIRNGIPFQPRRTKELGFSQEEKEKILRIVQPQLEKLRFHRITNLA